VCVELYSGTGSLAVVFATAQPCGLHNGLHARLSDERSMGAAVDAGEGHEQLRRLADWPDAHRQACTAPPCLLLLSEPCAQIIMNGQQLFLGDFNALESSRYRQWIGLPACPAVM
jgi:hypothetical protein